ncbi:MAG: hypothetical protein GY851_22075 [bacterium]|nr:hypothetical protein [bacterium]
MAFDGGPPIYDRIVVRRRMAAAAVVVLLLFVGGLVGLMRSGGGLPPEGPEPDGMDTFTRDEARELEDAYEAAQRYVLGELRGGRVREVDWGPRMHEGHLGWYRFEGPLDVTGRDGKVHPFRYDCAVSLTPQQDWKLEQIAVRKHEEPAE